MDKTTKTQEVETEERVVSPVLSVAEACLYLGVRKTMLYSLLKSGELPSFTIGSRRMIRRADADALVDRLAEERKGKGL
jgi:excisionase family DNA binding protein